MLSKSHTQRIHLQRQLPLTHEPERGRSRTPKPTGIALDLQRQQSPPLSVHRRIFNSPTSHISRTSPVEVGTVVMPRRRPPPKCKSPDRSVPGALEVAIHEANARGDLRQCLQWVLEIQGIRLEWDDPRLDTVTEDDLCFSEQTGMGPDATPEERSRAIAYWAMRQAEEDEKQQVWELTATPAEKEASRRLRAKYEAEQRKREARIEFFRAPRTDKVVPASSSSSRQVRSIVSRSLHSALHRTHTIPRTNRSHPQELFPIDEDELTAMRSMWLDQGRRGLTLVEDLIRLAESSMNTKEITEVSSSVVSNRPTDEASPPNSASSSSSSSAPSTLFSSVITTASTATSVSTEACPDSPSTSDQKNVPPAKHLEISATLLASPKFTSVAASDSPLHKHLVYAARQNTLVRTEHARNPVVSVKQPTIPAVPRKQRSTSEGWLRRGSKAVGGFVNLVGRLPSVHLPVPADEVTPLRSASCPPTPTAPPTPTPQPETLLYLLPLRPPVYPLTFPPLPALPRSPYRPRIPPPLPTPRARCVPNPQFLRLKALQNRVLWGLVTIAQEEREFLTDNMRRHSVDTYPGRPDVDRLGQMFTAREALVRVVIDGAGASKLHVEFATAVAADETTVLWGWLRARG